MPRTSKGARLVWRDESRKANGKLRNSAGWFIRDGTAFTSACGGTGDRERAEKALAAYISDKYEPARDRGSNPDDVEIADAINVYLKDVVPSHAEPKATSSRLIKVLLFFGDKRISDINGRLCRAYAEKHGGGAAARRQLEDLRAALKHYHAEGYCRTVPAIVMPEKGKARQRWLTRSEAARLLWAAWRMKQTWKGRPSDRRTGRHVARFMLVALYTGTRSAAICAAAIRPTEGRGYVDLERGVFFRRAPGTKETSKRQPPVRLPDRLLAHLRRWARTPVQIKTKRRGKSQSIGRMVSHDHVVEWAGKPVQSVAKSFRSARDAAELSDDVTPHVFRHTAATWLMQQGADLWSAAGFLGMTVEVLIEVYGHHHPDFQADAAAAITSKRRAPKQTNNVVPMRDAKRLKEALPDPTGNPTETLGTNENKDDRAIQK